MKDLSDVSRSIQLGSKGQGLDTVSTLVSLLSQWPSPGRFWNICVKWLWRFILDVAIDLSAIFSSLILMIYWKQGTRIDLKPMTLAIASGASRWLRTKALIFSLLRQTMGLGIQNPSLCYPFWIPSPQSPKDTVFSVGWAGIKFTCH